jgi:hypothetical protein
MEYRVIELLIIMRHDNDKQWLIANWEIQYQVIEDINNKK